MTIIKRSVLKDILDAIDIDLDDKSSEGPAILAERGYRGRGESERGFAMVCDNQTFARFLIALGAHFQMWDMEGDGDWMAEKDWHNWKQDQLGRDIVFYWPNVQVEA